MLRMALLVCLLLGTSPQQSGDDIVFSADVNVMKPGEVVTLSWEVPDTFSQLDHVMVEMSHPQWVRQPQTFADLPPHGTLAVTVPEDYYDEAVFRLYPEKAGGTHYVDDNGMWVNAEITVRVDDGVEVVKFRADPNPAQRNTGLLISWEISGLETASESVYLAYYRSDGLYEQDGPYPPVGTAVLEIPPYYTEAFDITLVAPNIMTNNHVQVDIICPFSEYLSSVCPYEQKQVEFLYQRFEHGMLLRLGADVYLVYDYGGFFQRTAEDNVTLDPVLTPPDGMLLPDAMFASVWTQYQEQLGWATEHTDTYNTLFESYPDTTGRYRSTGMLFYLPSVDLIDANVMSFSWMVVE